MSDTEPITHIGAHSDGASDQSLDRSVSGSLTNLQETFSQQQVNILLFSSFIIKKCCACI